MANIIVSNCCNLHCSYCFAQSTMAENQGEGAANFIDMEAFENALDLVDRLGVGQIRLLGGEPTLHPQFQSLLEIALQRGKPLLVFSNGLMPEEAVAALEQCSPETCTVLINMSAGDGGSELSPKQRTMRFEVLQRLGTRVRLGLNIYQPVFSLEPLFEVIQRIGSQRSIRLGLAHPVLEGSNRWLRPRHYPQVAHQIVQAAKRGFELGVRLEFDCGFVRCMFTNQDLEILHAAAADVGWRCNPVLDLDIHGVVYHCYPLASQFSTPLALGPDPTRLRDQFVEQTAIYRAAGIYPECAICQYRQSGECMGGCLATVIRRYRWKAVGLKVPSYVFPTAGDRAGY